MATENVIMAGVRGGHSRQDLHEQIRVHSHESARRMKEEGASNDLLERMRADEALGPFVSDEVLDPVAYVGRSPQQVDEFIAEVIEPLLTRHAERRGRFVSRVAV